MSVFTLIISGINEEGPELARQFPDQPFLNRLERCFTFALRSLTFNLNFYGSFTLRISSPSFIAKTSVFDLINLMPRRTCLKAI